MPPQMMTTARLHTRSRPPPSQPRPVASFFRRFIFPLRFSDAGALACNRSKLGAGAGKKSNSRQAAGNAGKETSHGAVENHGTQDMESHNESPPSKRARVVDQKGKCCCLSRKWCCLFVCLEG